MSDADIAVAEVTSTDDIWAMEWAKAVAEELSKHYPAHLWAVAWQGGALVVKNMSISGQYGMILEDPKKSSLKQILRDARIKGGELLERCGMKRGQWNGEAATHLEGSDPRFFQPWANM